MPLISNENLSVTKASNLLVSYSKII